uniref:ATP synthase subunit gamma, mitochondrial n=1 Tax=Reclinomonas americana TaxID=48483 RepID=O21267_RECAM|nr:ATP synthase F1 subunit gamma [Reclinomonas americana]AAD11894.1 ATP synthase F1 subunit gamma [Reclinomonas americana]
MASTKDFKNRIKSITSIRKITKAMKMVAASKLRQAQRNLDVIRPYFKTVDSLFNEYQNASSNESIVNNKIVVPISSDRGLCGGINTNVVKATKALVTKNNALDTNASIICVGIKAKDQLQRLYGKIISTSITDVSKKGVSFANASLIAEEILNTNYDTCYLVYNQFRSVLTQNVIESKIASRAALENSYNEFNNYEMEPSKSDVLFDLYEYYLGLKTYYVLIENVTSEQGARMNAMDNAAKNAGEMIDKLTLIYNKARQASITSELIEIISCASAVSSSKN